VVRFKGRARCPRKTINARATNARSLEELCLGERSEVLGRNLAKDRPVRDQLLLTLR
jgi:hypothetical protein